MADPKYLLVLERSEATLDVVSKTSNDYVLKGIFTEFGVKNANERIYDEKEAMPHILELKKMCNNKKLLGELDHPKSYEISLRNVSHVIESLEYDKEKQQVIGQIRLLNTDAGKNARALVDAGVPLHISSRAAGLVESNGHVKIKKMFTYDLVATPGFPNAQLNRVNESYGFSTDGLVDLFEVDFDESVLENEVQIYNDEHKQNENKMADKYITLDQFNQYSELIKSQFNDLKESIAAQMVNESATPETNAKLVKYVETIAKRVNELQDVVSTATENISGLIRHNDYIVENMESILNYTEYAAKENDTQIQAISETQKSLANYLDSVLVEGLNKRFDYMDEVLVETVQNLIAHNDHIVEESTSKFKEYDTLHENMIAHSDYVVEGIESVIAYAEYLKEEAETHQAYVGKIVETLNENLSDSTFTSSTPSIVKSLNESDSYQDEIKKKLNALYESEAKKSAEYVGKYNFLNFLTEAHRTQFDNLDKAQQDKIVNTFAKSKYYGSAIAEQIWESCFTSVEPVKKLNWLTDMPRKFVPVWESLNESQRNSIKAQASIRKLETQYQIDDFWQTRDLSNVKIDAAAKATTIITESSEYKTSGDYMDSVRAGMRRLNKRY